MPTTIQNLLGTVLLVCMLLTAGCAGIGFDSDALSKQTAPVLFIANNTASSPYTFEVFVVTESTNVSVKESDGKSDFHALDWGPTSVHPSEGHYFTEVRPDSGRHYGNFTLNSSESIKRNITELPSELVILVVVYNDENQIESYMTSSCDDGDLLAVEVTSHSRGVVRDYVC